MRAGTPGTTYLCAFSQVMLFYMLLNGKKVPSVLCVFLLLMTHKIFRLSIFFVVPFYFLLRLKKSHCIMGLCCFSLFCCCFLVHKRHDVERFFKLSQRLGDGNSPIPVCPVYKRILNFYLAPLNTNLSLFFYKSKTGNLFGWMYAIYVNFLVLFMTVEIIRLRKVFVFLKSNEKNAVVIGIACIASFSLTGIYLINYLNGNRHLTNVLVMWLIPMMILRANSRRIHIANYENQRNCLF